MYIVVSDNKNTPPELEGQPVEHWTMAEFIDKANAEDDDDGLVIEDGLYVDVSCLEQEVYEAMIPWFYDDETNVVLYKFDIDPAPSYNIDINVNEYSYAPDEPEVPNIPEPVIPMAPVVETAPVAPEIPIPAPEQPTASESPIPKQEEIPSQPETPVQPEQPKEPENTPLNINGMKVTEANNYTQQAIEDARKKEWTNILKGDDEADLVIDKPNDSVAKVILFGSSKGGTGKTFTCLLSAYWYSKTHPNEKIALADFDIIDGQIGITINKVTPTVQDYYKHFRAGESGMRYLNNCKLHAENFPANIDFYLAPPQDIPEVTDNVEFWDNVFRELITHYDVVFFDSGIDYLGKVPISKLYKIADKIILTSNPSINSVKSVVKQINNLSGKRANNVFYPEDHIIDRINVVLTRVYDNDEINQVVFNIISELAPIIALFGNIDNIVSRIQWFQQWGLVDANPGIIETLENIINLSDIKD